MTFNENIHSLRKKARLSQEEFAELFNVSRQSVQKWENGSAMPEISKITEISKYFGVSIDVLLLNRSSRMAEELNYSKEITPYYEDIPDWEFYASAVSDEYKQAIDEGLDVSVYKELFDSVAKLPKNAVKNDLGNVIHKIVMTAKQKEDYKYTEPSDLDKIKALRKPYSVSTSEILDLEEKVYGAWMGRVCGCMLGKTVESIRTAELVRFLKETDNFPMNRYILETDLEKVDLNGYNYGFATRKYADSIDGMPVDDDTNYTVLAQIIFEKYGKDFSPEDVASAWLDNQPKNAYCTAERVAFCNFVKGYRPPESAIHKNPYREWIGAQIRADYWGYINPGNPEKAAEYAWRDASISHVKNGIYGEMFVAAMIAAAACTSDTEEIILAGLAQIPCTSRLYDDIMQILDGFRNGTDQKAAFEYIHERYDESDSYGWCHTNSNAMIVVASLLYGGGDFGKSLCMSVETGFDTDCNGATVGSILGMANGIKSIPEYWSKPFGDKLNTSIFGVGAVKISDMASKTLEHIKIVKD